MSIKTADGKHNFKTCLYFKIFKLSSLSGTLLTLSALHAIRRFRMQSALKGIWLPFATCPKGNQWPFCKLQEGIRLPHAILFDFRGFFEFCMRYLIPFCRLPKGGKYPFQIIFCISLFHETIFYLLEYLLKQKKNLETTIIKCICLN